MTFFFGKTPRRRAQEQLDTQRERERLKREQAAEEPYTPLPAPAWRRIDEQGVAEQREEIDRTELRSHSATFAMMVLNFVQELGVKLRRAEDLNMPEVLPPHGPFAFTVVGKKSNVHFACEHHGEGRVTFKTDATGDAEYEVDVQEYWEKELGI